MRAKPRDPVTSTTAPDPADDRRGDPAVADAGADSAGVSVPPPLYYVAGFLVGVGLEAAFPIDRPPGALAVAMIVAGVAGWALLDGAATLGFSRAGTSMIPNRPSSVLVTGGPYRLTRNPMYVGMAFLYVAAAFALGYIWPLGILPFVLLAIDRLVIPREEAYLTRRFGQDYRDYTARTRRWL